MATDTYTRFRDVTSISFYSPCMDFGTSSRLSRVVFSAISSLLVMKPASQT